MPVVCEASETLGPIHHGDASAMTAPRHHDLTKTTLGVLTIGVLIAVSLWILRPFLGATVWAAMVVVATWPAL